MIFKFKRKSVAKNAPKRTDQSEVQDAAFDAVFDQQAQAASFSVPHANSSSVRPLMAGLMVLILMALGLCALWYHGRQTSRLLDGIGQIRASVRASYNSQQGYGLVAGAPLKPAQWHNQLPEGWSMEAGAPQHNMGNAAALRSQVSTFELRVDGIWPLSCVQILPLLDNGWKNVRYDGHSLSLPVSEAEAREACGYFHSGTLEMVSTG
jgi:hypothetical protein